jgi:hypothetical protein
MTPVLVAVTISLFQDRKVKVTLEVMMPETVRWLWFRGWPTSLRMPPRINRRKLRVNNGSFEF